jgi:ketosteroid isomerase-like protein
MKNELRASLAAAAVAMLSLNASAANLGRIHVLTTLGQPLRVEIEATGTRKELDSLRARFVPPGAFERSGVDYPSYLSSLKIVVEKRAGAAVLKISSDQAFEEPFVEVPLEVEWAGGRLVREYTFLLDLLETSTQIASASPGAVNPNKIPGAQTGVPGRSDSAARDLTRTTADEGTTASVALENAKPENGDVALDVAAIGKAVRDWAAAWSRKDVGAYLGFYAKDFRTPKGKTRSAWEGEREVRITKPGPIEVAISELRISVDGDTASAHFLQAYGSTNLRSTIAKTLVLVRRDDRWQILQERVDT